MVALPKTSLRPLSSAVISQSQTLAAQNTTPVAFLPQVRSFQTSPVTRDIDSAAKFIGAGAATVGVAGSGKSVWKFVRMFFDANMHAQKKWESNDNGFCLIACCGLVKILHLGHPYEYLVTLILSVCKPREGLRHGETSLLKVKLIHSSRMLF